MLQSYRSVIFVLLTFATALMVAALVFLVTIIALNRRISAIQRSGIQVSSLLISREARAVYINDMEFALTEAAIETLSVLAEARMDDEVMTGAQIEGVISGRDAADCDEAAGATRVKRLRDALGNQMVSELLVKTDRAAGLCAGGGERDDPDDLTGHVPSWDIFDFLINQSLELRRSKNLVRFRPQAQASRPPNPPQRKGPFGRRRPWQSRGAVARAT